MADIDKEITVKVRAEDDTAKATQSAKARLKDLQKQMLDLEQAGQKNTEAFRRMAAEAGQLKDAIGDTSAQVKALASDTRTLDTFTSAIQGIAGGFAVAQGAAALFGEENEDVQKAMMKVQAALALVNGATALANTLNKDSALMVNLNAAAQRAYAVAVGTSTGALKAFRIALVSTGIGAAVVAIGLLVQNYDKLTAAVKNFLGIQTRDQEALDAAVVAEQRRFEIMQAQGAEEQELHEQEIRVLNAKIQAAKTQEEVDQLRHEGNVANIAYETKLNQQAAQQREEQAAKEKALYESTNAARMATENEFALFEASLTLDVIEREEKIKDKKLQILNDELNRKKQIIEETIQDETLKQQAIEQLNKDYNIRRINILNETNAKITDINKKTVLELQNAQISALQAVADFSSALSGQVFKNTKALAYAALAFTKGVAIADVLVNLSREKQAINANIPNTIASPDFGASAKAVATKLANIRAGFAIAKILATGIGEAKAIGGNAGDGSAGGGGAISTGGGMAAPQGNALNPNSQLLNPNTGAGGQASPLRAYVVESDVSGVQQRLRQIRQFAQLGMQ